MPVATGAVCHANHRDIYSLCNARDDRPPAGGANPEPHFVRLYREIKTHLETHATALREEMEACQGDIIKMYNTRFNAYYFGTSYTSDAFRFVCKSAVPLRCPLVFVFGEDALVSRILVS